MAFTGEQIQYIEKTIRVAIGTVEEKVGTVLKQGEAMQTELKAIVEKHNAALKEHNAELNANADRVTALVDKAYVAQEKLEGSTAKIDDANVKIKNAEQIATDLMEKLRLFEANFEDHRTQLIKLNSDTETAVQGLDVKLQEAVASTRADVQTEFNNQNEKLHIFCNGIKAEVQANFSGNSGGKCAGFEGKAGGKARIYFLVRVYMARVI